MTLKSSSNSFELIKKINRMKFQRKNFKNYIKMIQNATFPLEKKSEKKVRNVRNIRNKWEISKTEKKSQMLTNKG